MKTDKEIKQIAIQKLGYDCHEIIYNTFILAYKLGCTDTEQKLFKHSVSGKRPDRLIELLLQSHYGCLENEQVIFGLTDTEIEELEKLIEIYQAACANGAVDKTVCEGSCEHDHDYKGGDLWVCNKCGDKVRA